MKNTTPIHMSGKSSRMDQKAWVAFTGQSDLPWLKILRPGYRHCFVLLHDGQRWITFDPLSSYLEILAHNLPTDFDLPLWLSRRGYTLVEAGLNNESKPALPMIFSCVEAVKRVLGLRKFFIFTPWQLYRHLSNIQSSKGV